MKTKRKAMTKYYWTCHYPEHRHKNQEIAERCIYISENRKEVKWTPKRMAQLLFDYEVRGIPVSELAEREGLSKSYIHTRIRWMRFWNDRMRNRIARGEELSDSGKEFQKAVDSLFAAVQQ